jgi:hypothetical protein
MLKQVLEVELDGGMVHDALMIAFSPTEITNEAWSTERGGTIPWDLLRSGSLTSTLVVQAGLKNGIWHRFKYNAMVTLGLKPRVKHFWNRDELDVNILLKYVPGGKL